MIDLDKKQKEVIENKKNHGWSMEIPREFCLLYGEVAEAYDAYNKNKSKEELGLELHMGKLELTEVHRGVEFLGMFIKPWRTYLSNHSLARIRKKIAEFDYTKPWKIVRSVNSYLGIFRHTASYNLTRKLLMKKEILCIGVFNIEMTKFKDRKLIYKPLKNVTQ